MRLRTNAPRSKKFVLLRQQAVSLKLTNGKSVSGVSVNASNGQNRTRYSLRRTYATLALVSGDVDIHTLSRQMGTSVAMLERHYSKLTATMAAARLG